MKFSRFAERAAFAGIMKPFIRLTGNRWMQNALDGIHHVCQHLMGIGSGTSCNDSGEKAALHVMKEVSSPPYTIFDVGANIGTYTQLVGKMLAPSIPRIHAFEPGADSFAALRHSLGDRENVCLNHAALGMQEGKGTLYSDSPRSGLASLTQRDLAHEGRTFDRTEQVRITTLDGYCREHDIQKIDLLKIDVEGHDLDVMKGGINLFRNKAITMLTFEFGSPQIDARVFLRDIYRFVREQEMDVFRITRAGYLYHLPAYHERHEQFWTTNFLCIQNTLSHASKKIAASLRRQT